MAGLSANSAVVNFMVEVSSQKEMPGVKLIKPYNDQVFISGVDEVLLVAIPNEAAGKINNVEFYNGESLLARDTKSPYEFNWSNISEGNYQVYAKVNYSGNIQEKSEMIAFSVVAYSEPQNIENVFKGELISPVQNAEYIKGKDSVVLKTNVSDSGVSIAEVAYFNGESTLVTLNSGPFEYSWTDISEGQYKVSAKITDILGNVYYTETIQFTVKPDQTEVPVLIISMAPEMNNRTFIKGEEEVILKSIISDVEKAQKVQYFNDGYLIGESQLIPFDFVWSEISVGDYRVHASVMDLNGKISQSDTIYFTVKNPDVNSVESSVKIVKPYEGQVFVQGKDLVTLKAEAIGVEGKVDFFNWYLPLVSVSNPNLEFDWRKITPGNYLVYAQAKDANGNIIQSEPVAFQVVASSSNTNKNQSTSEIKLNGKVTDQINISIENQEIDPDAFGIKIGPNPADSYVRIFFDGYPSGMKASVSLIDMTGIVLEQQEGNTSDTYVELDVEKNRPGVYLIRVVFDDKYIRSKKLIIN